MKKLITIIITLHASLFTLHEVTAQWGCACLPEGITFTRQAEIDSFQVNYPGCKTILGSVDITVGGSSPIRYLDGLSGLTFIGGDLYIKNDDLLYSLTGLDSLNSIGGSLYIDEVFSLASLTGLEGLKFIGGDLSIVSGWSPLSSFTGLENLASIGGSLYIYDNDALISLTGLANVNSIGGDLSIYSNPMLCICDIDAICAYLTDPNGTIEIHDNAPGCNSEEEVEEACLVGVGQLDSWTVASDRFSKPHICSSAYRI